MIKEIGFLKRIFQGGSFRHKEQGSGLADVTRKMGVVEKVERERDAELEADPVGFYKRVVENSIYLYENPEKNVLYEYIKEHPEKKRKDFRLVTMFWKEVCSTRAQKNVFLELPKNLQDKVIEYATEGASA